MKRILAAAALVVAAWLSFASFAFARGGCFAADTLIATPRGSVEIQDLRVGDIVLSLNPNTKQMTTSTIGEIAVFYDSYYTINGTTRVTSSHPFYVLKDGTFEIREVKDLEVGDLLYTKENGALPITSISHSAQKIPVYNLVAVTPGHDYFANGYLVHNKGGGGGGGGGGSHHSTPFLYNGASYQDYDSCNAITDSQAQQQCRDHYSLTPIDYLFFAALGFILLAQFPLRARHALSGKVFTEDQDVISYARSVVPAFTNSYSYLYSTDTETWEARPLKPEIPDSEYGSLIPRDTLIAQTKALFQRYESDWTHKRFEEMKAYVTPEYFEKQSDIFEEDFGENFDITYRCEISALAPIQSKTTDDGIKVQMQLCASMIDFELLPNGKVRSGEPFPREFTEYWTLLIKSTGEIYIADIDSSKSNIE